jgi:cell division protein FtsL
MSPVVQSHGKKITAADNLYTVILAVAFLVVLAAAVFVTYQCYSQYDTIFKIQ